MTIFAYLDSALLMALLLTSLSKHIKVICNLQVVAIIVGLLLPAVLISDTPLYQYIRAGLGDLSVSLKIILLVILYQRGSQSVVIQKSEWKMIIFGAAITGLLFYPFALGVTMFDPYAFGYAANNFVLVLLVLLGLSIWKKLWLLTAIICLSLVGYYGAVLESSNLWDYVLDPVLWLYALAVSCARLCKKVLPNTKPAQI